MPLDDDVCLAQAIVCLVDQADERKMFGAETRKYAERYLARDGGLQSMLENFNTLKSN